MTLDIQLLNTDRTDDFMAFFDHAAFKDNPDWAGCYCQYYHYAAGDPRWDEAGGAENRALAEERIRGGQMQGYLAYADNRVVGWCNAGPKTGYIRLMSDERFPGADDALTFSLVCYVVDAGLRRRGIAKALLHYACADARGRGFELVEAYPQLHEQSDAGQYHGPQSMYEAEGFLAHKELGALRVMRLKLV